MAKIAKNKVEQTIRKALRSKKVVFKWEKIPGGRLSGSIVSDAFKEQKDIDRQKTVWDALEAAFGSAATQTVGTLLTYTVAEWNVELAEAE